MSGPLQEWNKVRADKPGRAGNNNSHGLNLVRRLTDQAGPIE